MDRRVSASAGNKEKPEGALVTLSLVGFMIHTRVNLAAQYPSFILKGAES
jgi:hypothetical protein